MWLAYKKYATIKLRRKPENPRRIVRELLNARPQKAQAVIVTIKIKAIQKYFDNKVSKLSLMTI